MLKPGTKGKECWPIKNHVLCKRFLVLVCVSVIVLITFFLDATRKDKMRVRWKVINIIS